eukprot:68657_1
MLTLAARHSLRSYNAQLPALLINAHPYSHALHKHLHNHTHTKPISPDSHLNHSLHHLSHHSFSWSSEQNRRSTAPKPISQGLQSLKGAEDEYPGEWNESGVSKKPVKPEKTDDQDGKDPTYLEDEYFGTRSPIQEIHGLIKPKLPDLDKKEALTPLAEEIKQIIHARGPMTFSTFWSLCMQHDKYGYYMTKDPIGREGDFITTPEMFSGFSECLAVWCAFTWESLGRPPKIKIIEYGPGLGSVAKTMMDVVRKSPLKPFKDAISFHFIESSSRLRWKQKTKLGLGNVRKFKTRVQKPVYAVTDVSPYAQRTPREFQNETRKLEKPQVVSTEQYHKDPETKTKLMGLDTDPIQIPKKSKGITPINTDPEIPSIDTESKKRRIRPLVAKTQSMSDPNYEFKTREDIPPELLTPTPKREDTQQRSSNILEPGQDLDDKMRSNPFKTDRMFGEMSGPAMGAMGLGGNMQLTEDIKDKYKPFDWSQHHEDVFGHVDEEMKPYVTGQKTREWEQKHSEIKVHQDPLQKQTKIEDTSTAVSGAINDTKDQILDSANPDSIKVYNEGLSEYGTATTLPTRKTKRDIESQTALKEQLGFDEDAFKESQAPEAPPNPFQPILDKIEMQEIRGGTGAGIDFTDLMDFEDLKHETATEEEEIWQARTKDGILVSWHDSLHSIDGSSALFVCHEFFDALPISHFEFRPHGWVETVVDVDDDEDNEEHFKLVRGPVATFASTVLDRQFAAKGIKPSIGQQFSICSEGNEIANHISKWIKQYGGAGFIIDYGSDNIPAWTVQGIKQHKPANILSRPGEVDMSSHVNFNALKSAIESEDGVKAFGPVTQSYFLQGCGIVERFRQYVKDTFDSHADKESEENKKSRQDFFDTFAKIMDVDKLGGHFKVMGFGKESIGVPVGFRSPLSEKQARTDEMGLPVYK